MNLAEQIELLSIDAKGMAANTVCVDHDGTVAHETGGRGMTLDEKPIPHGIEMLKALRNLGYRVVILTANPNPDAVTHWYAKNGFPMAFVTSIKPAALAYIDSRAIDSRLPVDEIISRVKELTSNG